MTKETSIKLFENKKVHSVWDAEGGNETVTICNGLKMQASDGKMHLTDVADVEQFFRIIQSIPSPKTDPFKLNVKN